MELNAFNIAVIELRTGGVDTEMLGTVQATDRKLPESSIFAPAKEILDPGMRLAWVEKQGFSAERWAKEVAEGLLREKPAARIWSGKGATMMWLAGFLPFGSLDGVFRKMTNLDKVEAVIRAS